MFLSRLIALFCMSMYIRHVQCSPVPNYGNELFGDLFANAINYAKNNPETLEELINYHKAIIEGDMIMPSDRNALESIWPVVDGRVSVPYDISPLLADRTDTMLKAMEMVSEHTCVSFHNRTTEPDYVCFYPSKGCASFVGFQGGQQPLYIGPMCAVGNVVHELLHALGFHHEHTRQDRNEHIQIFENNIMKGSQNNFLMQNGKTFGIPYDSSSIMHYGGRFFSKNGLPTIVAKMDSDKMGQRTRLTPQDIKRVRVLYKCDEREKKWLNLMEFLNKFRRLKELYLRIPEAPANLNTSLPLG